MSEKFHISINAFVSENERSAVYLAARHLAQALSRTAPEPWSCAAAVKPDMAALLKESDAAIIVTSLLPELEHLEEPWTKTEKRLRATYAALCERGAPVFICTVLRHVGQDVEAETAEALIVRIRRLNLLAAEISRESGAYVIDLDRVLGDVGARRLQTDYRLAGDAAAEMAGHFMALTVLGNAPDELVTFQVQEAAREILVASRPAVAASEGAKAVTAKQELRAIGHGRRKQIVLPVVYTERDVYVGWFMRQVLHGKIGPGEVFERLLRAFRQHGFFGTAGLLVTSLTRQLQRKRYGP
jgi:hypothetical protein